jgi:hypothetical protein
MPAYGRAGVIQVDYKAAEGAKETAAGMAEICSMASVKEIDGAEISIYMAHLL